MMMMVYSAAIHLGPLGFNQLSCIVNLIILLNGGDACEYRAWVSTMSSFLPFASRHGDDKWSLLGKILLLTF